MKHLYALLTVVSTIMALTTACTARQDAPHDDPSTLLLEQGCYPYAVRHDGHYYYTMQVRTADTVAIWQTDDLGQLATARRRDVWTTADSASLGHFWSPELHRIHGRWYLYFEADDGNTDDHQIYVMECEGDDPMTDPFRMRGPIMTNPEWNFGLHPTVLQLPQSDQLYLLWSGWPTRRAETETQCIYIARMENPWTTGSERVMISQPGDPRKPAVRPWFGTYFDRRSQHAADLKPLVAYLRRCNFMLQLGRPYNNAPDQRIMADGTIIRFTADSRFEITFADGRQETWDPLQNLFDQ